MPAIALFVLALVAATSTAAPQAGSSARGCERPAGAPDEAAVLQYCPKKSPKKQGRDTDPVTGAVGETGSGPSAPAPAVDPPGEPSSLPLLDYPSSDGISTIVWILLAILVAIVARAVYRRYLAGRIGSRRPPRLPTRGASGN